MRKTTLFIATVCMAITLHAQSGRAVFSGNGLSDSTAYLISTPAQLARLAELVNSGDSISGKYFKLTADIDLSAYGSGFNGGKGWIPIGSFTAPFSGHFNGSSHTVSGLYINDSELEFAGLFGVIIGGGTVQNLNIEVNITAKHNVGGIAGGIGYFSGITNCSVNGAVSGGVSVGGIAGHTGGSINNCYAAGAVNGNDIVGGIAGSVGHNAIVTGCYAAGEISGVYCVGGVAGHLYQSTVENCAAFNPVITRVSGVYTEFGRVAGHNEEGTLSGNAAREDMVVIDDVVTNQNGAGLNGVDINRDIISRDGTIGGRFTESNGWMVTNGKLPGFNSAVELPERK